MSKIAHSPNCQCPICTSNDPYIAHVRNQFGKNANFAPYPDTKGYSGGSKFGFNEYDSHFANHADAPVLATKKANLKQILGDALGGVVGDLIQAKKDGETLPPLLDKVAGLGIKTEQAAVNAAQNKTESVLGKQVLSFSPIIIGALVGGILLITFLLFKSK